ncbi:hypothetical protein H7F15_01275 [Pontibacter sp. Tf4]|uniref:hypothetical protein n=1 Tax=Pontibacter sp. Tf4 TaxID=2761620 RepID=UPI0016258629|nr:hypothetical protein [Pontibacter sp. Tf4]MBB6609658.1 hypothetical protein [Pontibacter sp. Tf4]
MKSAATYYRVAVGGALLTLVAQGYLWVAVDPFLPAVLSPLYAVWIMVFVVGWRKKHPRR